MEIQISSVLWSATLPTRGMKDTAGAIPDSLQDRLGVRSPDRSLGRIQRLPKQCGCLSTAAAMSVANGKSLDASDASLLTI
jgi:hypothetical protein